GALHLNFHLAGEGGEIGLFAPDLTLIDCTYYAQQRTGVSQGRSPNGSERIIFLDQPTPGAGNTAPNIATGGLVINEVLANNVSQNGADSTEPDWIELYNPTNTIVDLSGMSLSDRLSTPTRWVFPAGSRIQAFNYFRVNFDANSPTNATNTGFGLKATGDAVYLFNRASAGGALLDSVTFGIQAPDFSLARVPNGSTNWVLGNPTLLAQNIAATLGSPSRLKINEWLANPKPGNPDWFEVYNPDAQPVAIGGLHLSDKIGNLTQYQIPPRSFIGTGLRGFQVFYADGETAAGANHVPFGLSATRDFIYISDARGSIINDVEFTSQVEGVSEGLLPDGNTNVIVRFPTTATPEESNYLPINTVVVNEVLSHADDPFEDAIELRNLTATNVNIGGWYLSDSVTALKRFRIPDNTILSPNSFKVFYQNQFNPIPGDPGSFSLSAAHGDEVHLSAADERAVLTGYRGRVSFGPAENTVSFGRFETSVDVQFVAMQSLTFGKDRPTNLVDFRSGTGKTNSYAKVGPVVISEIMYHPPDIGGLQDNVTDEFVVLRNITSNPVQLFHPTFPTNRWRLRDAVKFDIPPNTSLASSTSVYIVSFDPVLSPSTLAAFRNKYRVPTNIAVLGPYEGKLDNSGDSVELVKPDAPEPASNEGPAVVPYILADKVKYSDLPPWPLAPDGFGSVLRRINVNLFGNDPANWAAGDPRMPEPDSDGDGMPDSWESLYGLNAFSASDANQDKDGDGSSNLDEYLAGTNPNSASSSLRLQISAHSPVILRLNALADKSYTIEYAAELTSADWQPWAHIDSQSDPRTLEFPAEPGFYRVRTPRLP
ncbi:MAG TPA: lamin tail domain-containing protein, partial [Verrucomicrobiae bacterium]|nr:lamin tail domain-containing protein [Verrucomicrobiae bacterium]